MPPQPTMTVDDFVEKWSNAALREKANSQTHFNDLCAVVGVETPLEGDPSGETYTFEKRVDLHDGSSGQADVWKQDHFGWEYKSGGKSLVDAYEQLSGYREGLGNPPLLVVSDMSRFEIHTNFTNTAPRVIAFSHRDLRENPAHFRRILRDVFTAPENLHPHNDPRYITETAAEKFGEVAAVLRDRDSQDAAIVARFLNRIIFCLFAESVGLFADPGGRVTQPMRHALGNLAEWPELTVEMLQPLFTAMAEQSVHLFGPYTIRWFDGSLFDERSAEDVMLLTTDLVEILLETSELNWSRIDPAIFGTLFERGLDPRRRSQLGAHYTDPENIMRVVEPVVLRPLRAEFNELKEDLAPPGVEEPPAAYAANGELALAVPPDSPRGKIRTFLERLANLRVLDPACGSGNFLYVAMRALKDLEHEVIEWAQDALGDSGLRRRVGPDNMCGIDIDPLAVELTRMSLWIGIIQWNLDHDFRDLRDPVLGRTEQIECRDAILAENEQGEPIPAEWPKTDYIIGNPPFLGNKRKREQLGDDYVDRLRAAWTDAVGGQADLCTHWHEIARRQIERGAAGSAGLLATSSITGSESRRVLRRIAESGAIFFAYRNEPWVEDGSAVRIAVVGQSGGHAGLYELDGRQVPNINPDLTTGADVSSAASLPENAGVAFRGAQRTGPFDITREEAERMLAQPINVNSRPNDDVLFPFVIARDLVQRPRGRYIIDFGPDMPRGDAAYYEEPYEYLKRYVQPERSTNADERLRERWWLHEEWRPSLRTAIRELDRYLATPITAKHRVYVWLEANVVPDATIVAFARDDDYFFGILHSRIHELWALAQASRLGVGDDPRYVHTQCFNTFPFPWPLNTPDSELTAEQLEHRGSIAAAGKALHDRREQWLNPQGVNPILLDERTMTNLYNEPPGWLTDRHRNLNTAVAAAYGWPADISNDDILAGLLALNRERAAEPASV